MTLWRLLFFLVAWNMHIQVQAQSVLVQDPEGCLGEDIWCSMSNWGRFGHQVNIDVAKINLSSRAGVVFLPNSRIRVLDHFVHIKAAKSLTVEVYNFEAYLKPDDELFVSIGEQKVIARSMSGDISIRPRGHKKSVVLFEGFQNWFGAMSDEGGVLVGFPRPIDLVAQLRQWSLTYHLSRSEFRQEARDYSDKWQQAVHMGSDLNRQYLLRTIASAKKRRKMEKLRRQKRIEAEREMRQLFRERNGM